MLCWIPIVLSRDTIQYCRECPLLWKDIISTVALTISTVEDALVLWSDLMALEDFVNFQMNQISPQKYFLNLGNPIMD